MTERTEMIIHALKCNKGTFDERIKNVMAKYTGMRSWSYGREEIDKLLRSTCSDYISTCDKPYQEVRRYFLEDTFVTNEYQRMAMFLINIQVCEKDSLSDEYYYINGFHKEFWEE